MVELAWSQQNYINILLIEIQLFIYVILAKRHINHANKRFYGYVKILNQIAIEGVALHLWKHMETRLSP